MTSLPSPTRVLIVEDSESFVEALVPGLEREGFEVSVALDGMEAMERFERERPDLILLDVMLPRLSGVDVCRMIRARSDVPIIMVTAKSTELDTVVGLEVGADDYVAKPYRLRELVSRMRAVLRRRTPSQESATSVATSPTEVSQQPAVEVDILEAGGVRLDVGRHRCTIRGREVNLPLKEFQLLEVLLANAGRVVTRDTLMDHVWGMEYLRDTNTLDVHIKRLRTRLEADPSSPEIITTVRGVGYRVASAGRTPSHPA